MAAEYLNDERGNATQYSDRMRLNNLLSVLGNFVLLTSQMALIIDFRLDALLVPTLKSCVTEQQLCELIIAAK